MKRFLSEKKGTIFANLLINWVLGLAQIHDPLVMRITFEAVMMWPYVSILRCKNWYLWERNRFIGKLPRKSNKALTVHVLVLLGSTQHPDTPTVPHTPSPTLPNTLWASEGWRPVRTVKGNSAKRSRTPTFAVKNWFESVTCTWGFAATITTPASDFRIEPFSEPRPSCT